MREKQLAWLREDEIRFRSRGLYEMANQIRRVVELIDAGDDSPPVYTYMDRGTHAPIDGYLEGGMAIVCLPIAGITMCLTPDRAADLAGGLLEWLESFE